MRNSWQQNKEGTNRSSRTTRYMAVAFAVLALVLLLISAYSFLSARQVQVNYNKMVADSLHKLELINRLHHNEDLIYNAAVLHMQSGDSARMAELERNIQKANVAVVNDLAELNKIILFPPRRHILQRYTIRRKDYTSQLTQLLTASRLNRKNDATILQTQELIPAHHRHQLVLNELGDSITVTTRIRGEQALQRIDRTIRNYNLLLLASLLVTAVAAYLIRSITKQLRFKDIILSSERRERKQLRDALSESQVVYRTLFQNIAIPMWVVDQITAQILEVNEAALAEYGYTRTEFMSLTNFDLQPQEQIEEFGEIFSLITGIVTSNPGWRHKRKDGSTFFVDVKSHDLPTQGALQPRIVVAINIDEQVRATKELERREKQFHEISSSIPGAVYQFQLDKDFHVSFPFISEGIGKLYGLSPEDVKKEPDKFFDLVHPDDKNELWNSISESYQSLQPWQHEFRTLNKTLDSYIWLKGASLPTSKGDGVVIWNGTLIDITTQKEAQERLVASEANLRYLLNSSPQAIYLLDEHLKIIAFNTKAAEEVTNLQLKTLCPGESILSFIASDQAAQTVQYHKKALEGETTVYETNNAGLWHEVAFRPVLGHDQRVQAVALSVQDITEQKLILEAIRHNEMQLARAQELSQMGSWEHDMVTGRVVWSDNLYRIYGVTPQNFKPTLNAVQNLVHPDDAALVQQSYAEAIRTGKPTQIEHRVIAPSGEEKTIIQIGEIYYDDHRNPIRMSGSVQDITERKRVEQEATETKNLLQSILKNIPEIIFSTDAQFNITYISPQSLDILGYTDAELTGTAELWTRNVYPEDMEKVEQAKKELFDGKQAEYEVRVVSQDRKLKWLLLRLTPTTDENNRLLRLDGSAADITQHKLAEAKREELHKQLVNQNRNLQQFAYIVSHNLRAPIANILGLTSIYNRTNPAAPVNQKVIDNLIKSAQLLDGTIRDLNELLALRSGMQEDLKEELYFAAVLNDVTNILSEEIAAADPTLETDFQTAPAIVTIKSYLQSIVLNLVSNAIKYRDSSRKLRINLKTFVVDDYICLQVSDNGLGIDLQKEKDKIFGLYKRFHPDIAGKGLGLHLVKTQAELLGGKVEVESSPGVGTTFRVYFLK